jgi:hypothetical protein
LYSIWLMQYVDFISQKKILSELCRMAKFVGELI